MIQATTFVREESMFRRQITMSNDHNNLAEFGRWFEEVWNKKQPQKIVEFAAPNVVVHGLGKDGADLHGPEAFREVYDLFDGAFPDLHISLGPCVASGDTVAAVLNCVGSHKGPFAGRAATGKSISF